MCFNICFGAPVRRVFRDHLLTCGRSPVRGYPLVICGSDEPPPEARRRNMKLTCLMALFGLSSSLVISPPALPRAGMATRHRALFMQEEEDQSSKCDARQITLCPRARVRHVLRATCARWFAPEPPCPDQGHLGSARRWQEDRGHSEESDR